MIGVTGMMRCREALARLWDFLDGELAPDEERALKNHLDVCGRCFPQYDFQRAFLEYTKRLVADQHAPPELRQRLFRRILAEERGGGGGSR
jgi:mycothiol system anti-sigma-R factor